MPCLLVQVPSHPYLGTYCPISATSDEYTERGQDASFPTRLTFRRVIAVKFYLTVFQDSMKIQLSLTKLLPFDMPTL